MVESSREAASKAAAAKAAAAKSKPATSTSTVAGVPISVVPKAGQSYTPVAKPTTPSTQSLNLYGSPGANTRPINKTPVVEKPAKKPVKTTPAPATIPPFAMGAVGRGEYGPTTTTIITGDNGDVTTLRPSTRTAVYGADGKLLGYNVTNYNLDGSIASVIFEADLSGAGAEETVTGTTNIQVLKSMLISAGFSATLVEGSTTFLQTLLKDGLSEESAVDIYLNNKEFTTKTGTVLTSPFYSTYGFYNEKLTTKLTAKDLFNTVEGYKSTKTKYNLNDKFASQDYIQKYLSNNISVATLDENANKARLAAVGSDPLVISNLQQLGYIGTSADLTDFYLDPNVGMEKMQQNFNTAALSFEAVRRSNTGITFNKANFEKLGAGLTALGYNEGQTQYKASEAYDVIGRELRPTVGVSNIYEGANAGTAGTIQSELEQQEFNRIESLRIKKLKELETRSFQAESGQYTGKTVSGSNYSSAGQI